MNYLNKENFEQNSKSYQRVIDNHIFNFVDKFALNYKKNYQAKDIYKFITLQKLRNRINLFEGYNNELNHQILMMIIV